ncbi:MAG: aminopeptidase [Spirochaetaceae bacterium]|nr:aminopeptidase [Spirochaetaceae bacterium]
MILTEFNYDQYARLLLETGINLQKGQNLMIQCHVEGVLFARRCAETAYKMGAGIVEIQLKDTHLTKARVNAQAGDETSLGAAPGWTEAWQDAVVGDNWAYLALESFEDVGLMADADQDALAIYERLQADGKRRFRDAVLSHSIPWCVAGVPGDKWAKRVLGEDKNTDDLWRILVPILLLDEANPAEAWKKKADTLVERSDKLNSLRLDSLRFKGNGTDLTVGLLRQSVWVGGGERCEGRMTMPNIPTEEIFTTPDRRRCDGKVRITRPVEVRGTLVKGAVLEFSGGKLISFDTEEGREALAGYIETDPGASSLGEVALVGEDSPIARSGLIFDSILYDENASCHIALGSGYVSCLADADELDNDEKKSEAGCNVSLVHTDFMIGSPEISVIGVDAAGREVPIMENGRFVI